MDGDDDVARFAFFSRAALELDDDNEIRQAAGRHSLPRLAHVLWFRSCCLSSISR